jgi:hypothetical protein
VSQTAQPDSAPAIDEATVRLVDICPDCGYSLIGSPVEGACPECGRRYDQRVLILHGSAVGTRATLENASPRSLIWLLICGSFPLLISACDRPLSLDRWHGFNAALFTMLLASYAILFAKPLDRA